MSSEVFMCGCTNDHRDRTYHYCSPEHRQKALDKVKARARAEALEEAAKLAESKCHCAPFWAPYGRRDPSCAAHDIADCIRDLVKEAPKHG